MGSLKARLRRLEGPRGPERCPECAGRIVYAEHRPDGTVDYPIGGPCSTCGNRPADGTVGLIEVVLPADGAREGPRGAEARRRASDVWP